MADFRIISGQPGLANVPSVTATTSDLFNTYLVSTAAGNQTVTIAAPAGERLITVKKITDDVNLLTIVPPAGYSIENGPTNGNYIVPGSTGVQMPALTLLIVPATSKVWIVGRTVPPTNLEVLVNALNTSQVATWSFNPLLCTMVAELFSVVPDQSGNGRNATQATAGIRPPIGLLNARQCADLNGTTQFWNLSNFVVGSSRTFWRIYEVQTAPGALTAYESCSLASGTGSNQRDLISSATLGNYSPQAYRANAADNAAGVVGGSATDTLPHYVIWTQTGTTYTFSIDGVNQALGASDNINLADALITASTIGSLAGGSNFFYGRLAAMGLLNGVATAAQAAAIDAFALAEYGIA